MHEPMGVVQSDNVILPLVYPPEVPNENGADGTEEDAVRGHEVEETACAGKDLPGNHDPGNDGAEELPTANIDIGRKKSSEVISRGETISRNINAQRREGESEAGEEATRPVRPEANQRGGIPLQRAVVGETGGSGGDAAEGNEGEDDWEHGDIQPLPLDTCAAVAGEVGHVDGKGGVVADNGGEGRKPGVGIGGPADGGFRCGGEENAAGTAGRAEGPDQDGDEADGDDD